MVEDKCFLTDFTDLDKAVGTIKTGELVVFAGRPGMGRTTMLANICANKLVEAIQGNSTVRCAFFSFDHRLGYVREICESTINQNQSTKADELMHQLIESNILSLWEDDGPKASAFNVALLAAEMKYMYGLDILFIDDFDRLALYDGSGKAVLAERLKTLAEKLNIAIITSTPIRRVARRSSYCLEDIDLQLTRWADKIIFITRLDVIATLEQLKKAGIQKGDTEFAVMKNNNGINGYVKLKFDYSNGGFHNSPTV